MYAELRLPLLAAVLAFGCAQVAIAEQVVFLDFDTYTDPEDEYVYSMPERMAIKDIVESVYAPFPISFTLTDPGAFVATRLDFNKFGFGAAAEHIDFRNLDDDDSAYLNIPSILDLFAGEPLPHGEPLVRDPATGHYPGEIMVQASANTAAHELGHLLGLRHHDSFGPLGHGIGTTPGDFLPTYPGPTFAEFTPLHIMSMTTGLGLTLDKLLNPDPYLSERSAIKLEFNSGGTVLPEPGIFHNDASTPTGVPLDPMGVPNTLLPPEPGHLGPLVFGVKAGAIEGAIEESTIVPGTLETDYYSFSGAAGELVTIEVMSAAIADRIASVMDPFIYLLDGTTTLPISYHGPDAFNDNAAVDGDIGTDAMLLDVVLPYSGEYIIEVGAAGGSGPGEYELFLYSYSPLEPFCDFNGDAFCDIADINLQLAEGPVADGVPTILGENEVFDLDGDGEISFADVEKWLAAAALKNGWESPYRLGDANLDGVVDTSDFNLWNANKFTGSLAWDTGDFNGDGAVDASDFNLWNANKFLSSDGTAVPEPSTASMLLVCLIGLFRSFPPREFVQRPRT